MNKSTPYYNNHQSLYQGRQPPFYDPSHVAGIDVLEEHWEAIRDELAEVLADPVRAAVAFQKFGLHKISGWRQIELRIYGVDYPSRQRLFPRTMAVLERVEGVSTVYFSLLAPGAQIRAHVGDTDAFHRVHLGLRIPGTLPGCGIEVAGEQRSWREGGCVVFNDIFCHAAWNHSDEERVVLILDVLRPEFRGRAIEVNAGVRGTLYYSRLYEIGFPLIELMPRFLTRLLPPVFRLCSWITHSLLARRRRRLAARPLA